MIMSVISLIKDKIYEKEVEIKKHYSEIKSKNENKVAASRKKDVKQINDELNKLIKKAASKNIIVSISRSWNPDHLSRANTANSSFDASKDKGIISFNEKQNEMMKKELMKFEELSDAAQIAAELPASERRIEIMKILEELKKF